MSLYPLHDEYRNTAQWVRKNNLIAKREAVKQRINDLMTPYNKQLMIDKYMKFDEDKSSESSNQSIVNIVDHNAVQNWKKIGMVLLC